MRTVIMICGLIGLSGCAQIKETVSILSPTLGETLGYKPYTFESVDGEADQSLIVIKAMNQRDRFYYRSDAISQACIDEPQPEILAEKDNEDKSTLKIIVWCQQGVAQQENINQQEKENE